ncbi:group II intron maturase-specific domain-containing protein [Delftia tsuruhatensis]|uniref:group II intron maturase-specific domain-containing protein n=1 Tax=Delftia tsuruhatensis TaxID=180282 RepID=UPI0030D58613
MQALWKLALEPVAETRADPNSYGFRPERAAADAIEQCFTVLSRRTSAQWILEGDIRGCFDNFSHSWVLEHIPMDKVVLRQWLEAGYVDEDPCSRRGQARPKGRHLACDCEHGVGWLEAAVHASAGGSERARRRAKLNVIRYADDFVVSGTSKDVLESQVLPAIRRFMAERGLELSEEKTRITHIEQGFDFLGQNVRKHGHQCLTKPAKKSIKSLLDKVRDIIKSNANATQATVILQLNPVIRGWAMYHRHAAAKATFSSIDSHIWRMLWRWAVRRHPAKGARWVIRRYFRVRGSKSWAFATKGSADGTTVSLQLFRASTIAVTRHVKVPGAAHPFDPEWTTYLARRRAAKRSVNLFGATPWC